MNSRELFDEGNLRAALQACAQEVKAAPDNLSHRIFFFELLAFAGDLERADRQLDVVAHQDAKAEPVVQVYRNMLYAEGRRRKVLAGEAQPEFLRDAPGYAHLHLEALQQLRDGNATAAQARLEASAAQRPPIAGTLNGKTFDGLRDCDDVVAPFLELILLRDYAWLPFENIREIEIAPPERPRDLVWDPVRLVLDDGTQHRAYLPVLYAGSHEHEDDQVRLGRFTDWMQTPSGPVRGSGQRMLLVGDDGVPLLEIRAVTLHAAS
jgi:type VI secretion system protein ImpE